MLKRDKASGGRQHGGWTLCKYQLSEYMTSCRKLKPFPSYKASRSMVSQQELNVEQ